MYPVLMAADILMFKAHKIPVGRDQVQHIEMARDMAQSFNHLYGEHFVLPEAAIDESVAHAARPGRPQDEQELRQHHPAVRAARADAQADRRHRDRLARAGRAQGRRRLGAVPDLPGLRLRRGDRSSCARPTPTASPGATPSSCCSSASTARSRRCASATTRLIDQSRRAREHPAAGADKARARRHALHGASCATPWACATWRAQAGAGSKAKAAKAGAARLQAVPRSRRPALLQAGRCAGPAAGCRARASPRRRRPASAVAAAASRAALAGLRGIAAAGRRRQRRPSSTAALAALADSRN